MSSVNATYKEIIKRCVASVTFFLRNFGTTKHPSAGIMPFNPFSYQIKALQAFRKNRFVIFRKCRQSGVSKISGAFALWFAMFFSNKTVLIVSRTDGDAITFLRENVLFIFRNLPAWMQELWHPIKDNEHELAFPNGSRIRSLTSHPDVLRSNASSLNIVDEAAFIREMGLMWTAGYPTLQHGGSVIVVSTTQGVGNWYWSTWTDAEAGYNDFKPILINWWDMDWEISYKDALSGDMKTICPRAGIRECRTLEERERYGPFWSPWLEEQWRNLQERGESWKFDQEILAKFVGSGNTVLEQRTLTHMELCVETAEREGPKHKLLKGRQKYVHPVKGDHMYINFNGDEFRALDKDEGLWVWKAPFLGKRPTIQGKRIIDRGIPPHRSVGGVDIATGKGRDYFAMEIFDIDEMEQAAEIMIHTMPRYFKLMIDYVGRWYNNALLVIERNNGGDAFIDDVRLDLMYPNLWRRKDVNDKPTRSRRDVSIKFGEYGFFTSSASKPTINKALFDYLRPDSNGYKIYSRRLLKQANIYVRKKDRSGRDTNITEAEEGPGNHDDLVIAAGLAFLGINDAAGQSSHGLLPMTSESMPAFSAAYDQAGDDSSPQENYFDPHLLMPISGVTEVTLDVSIAAALERFTNQLGAAPMSRELPPTSTVKHQYFKR